jgi:hypothetical protein
LALGEVLEGCECAVETVRVVGEDLVVAGVWIESGFRQRPSAAAGERVIWFASASPGLNGEIETCNQAMSLDRARCCPYNVTREA